MSVAELHTAIRMDTGSKLTKSARAIESICQPLVAVDKDRVEVVHDTVREYLFGSNKDRTLSSNVASDFSFDRGTSHEQIAIICLNCLSKSLRTPARRMSQDEILRSDDVFLGKCATWRF